MSDMILEAPHAGAMPDSAEDPIAAATAVLKQRFPDHIQDETRDGYEGIVVHPDKVVQVSQALRDELGFNYLSSITGVDLIEENKLELVYHTYSINQGGPALVMKVQVDRDNPVLPSLVPVWPGAEYQEREAYDLFGFQFEGHPDLRRILTWDGFHGHPMRKDWKEPFFEEDNKPFGSRWPGGEVSRAEEKNPFGKNVQYPAGWVPTLEEPEAETDSYAGITYTREQSTGLKTDKVTINMGPQHPSTHGVFRMALTLDGETIVGLKPVMGYLHRNHEKI
ncbi:MAG: NADH-quinone oxidoreductase subunit C, partial [Anaerolineales bacterium]|nr:NADH-quinone oxidoreductase subunit C [Anaerolineales bacterium]